MQDLKKFESKVETKFALEEDMRFRAVMRRTRLLGEWAAALMGADAPAYAAELADLYCITPDDDAMAAKVHADLKASGIDRSTYTIRIKMVEFLLVDAPVARAA
jgi:hypothetical protein